MQDVPNAGLTLWLLFVIGASFACVVLLRFTWRGTRVGDVPFCRACGQNLTGLPVTSPRCPECGGDVSTPAGREFGERHRNPVQVAFATALTLAVAAVLTMTLRHHVPWSHGWPLLASQLPTTWLIHTISGPPPVAGSVTSRFRAYAAWELSDRLRHRRVEGDAARRAILTLLDVDYRARPLAKDRAFVIHYVWNTKTLLQDPTPALHNRFTSRRYVPRPPLTVPRNEANLWWAQHVRVEVSEAEESPNDRSNAAAAPVTMQESYHIRWSHWEMRPHAPGWTPRVDERVTLPVVLPGHERVRVIDTYCLTTAEGAPPPFLYGKTTYDRGTTPGPRGVIDFWEVAYDFDVEILPPDPPRRQSDPWPTPIEQRVPLPTTGPTPIVLERTP